MKNFFKVNLRVFNIREYPSFFHVNLSEVEWFYYDFYLQYVIVWNGSERLTENTVYAWRTLAD